MDSIKFEIEKMGPISGAPVNSRYFCADKSIGLTVNH